MAFLELTVGGYLLTGASNGFNQILEKEADAKMGRTAGRPLPTGRMSVRAAAAWSTLAGALGLAALFHLGTRAGLLGLLAIASYVLAYTPLKSRTGFSVLVGAIPGAIPPMLAMWRPRTNSASSRHALRRAVHVAVPAFLGHRLGGPRRLPQRATKCCLRKDGVPPALAKSCCTPWHPCESAALGLREKP